MPNMLGDVSEERGLGYCRISSRVLPRRDMYARGISCDGRRREQLLNNAMYRARKNALPVDVDMLRDMVFGPIPSNFNGVPYLSRQADRRGPAGMSLSLDRIRPSRGYVKGNVRFLPFWINRVLNVSSDAKARRLAERML